MNKVFLLINLLTSVSLISTNIKETYFNIEDNEEKEIIWVKDIISPTMKDDFIRYENADYIEYIAPLKENTNIYDVNKIYGSLDKSLCFACGASNALHYWLKVNEDYINRYLLEEPNEELNKYLNSFRSQSDSEIYKKYFTIFANNKTGFYSDLLIDNFINGYKMDVSNSGTNTSPIKKEYLLTNGPESHSGYFYNIFKENILTKREYHGNYDSLSKAIKLNLEKGNFLLIDYLGPSNYKHVVTLYGAEYNKNNELSAIYIADSDDLNETSQGLYRLRVNKDDLGRARLTTSINKNVGAQVEYLQILERGEEYFEKYFSKEEDKGTYTINFDNSDCLNSMPPQVINIDEKVKLNKCILEKRVILLLIGLTLKEILIKMKKKS